MENTLRRNWLIVFIIGFGIFNILPFFAPIFMHMGWTTGGNAVYTVYGFFCHQMAQRSFFFFGDHFMMNADTLPVNLTGNTGADTLLLRNFKGNEDIGWKVAWSDRMVYLYGSLWIAGIIYYFQTRRRLIQPISIPLFILSMLPLGLDGISHFFSDFAGLTAGFRYTNDWLASLTGHLLPNTFYRGDVFGSFNSLMRLLSGVIFGFGAAYFAFPHIDIRLLADQHFRLQRNQIRQSIQDQSIQTPLK